MNNLNKFDGLTNEELSGIVGGKGAGWIGLLQPAYDLVRGVAAGVKNEIRKHGA
ncbi:hypothetical protein FO433_03540 [Weissella cibaria]|uniref:lactococcin G-beta/enterocin 1071B family bacteriocin n=1 Tax=Weissella cibaria TaxID=137591 RepID=UPI00117E7E57|nr:lactococcin G-beta/enterocin 1071B family bacteriocin [Weissella cibaria]MCT0954671.1 hypothetical protein [Weissella cibaria]TVV19046.1 hypothetical protein FQP82_04910 [Weissella cibaria]TVV24926.1 hypothetical protein FO433_03540 [Weissella cibaria]TVV31624.1 hypothetical protein FO434_04960 [Weissella cibaria]